MQNILRLIVLLACIVVNIIQVNAVCVVVHGTWVCSSGWHLNGGDFYNYLHQAAQKDCIELLSFCWPGKVGHKSRMAAGKELADYLEKFSDLNELIIIVHSHGANIVFVASEILYQRNSSIKISLLYTLGAPIAKNKYVPNMNIINYIYHLFSFADLVQPVFGFFERQFDTHERIANLLLFINDQEPGHSELHHPLVGKWLLSLHRSLELDKIGNFEQFNFLSPGIIYLNSNTLPLYKIDLNRNFLIEQDKKKIRQLRKKLLYNSL